jgi:uncharacterized membrane protein HdeD (DUF308 family)
MTAAPTRSTTDVPRWIYFVRAVAAIVFGVAMLTWPGLTLATLAFGFGVYSLVEGLADIVLGFARRTGDDRWGLIVLSGALSVLTGIAVLVWPGLTALTLIYVIGFWAIVNGVLQVVDAFRDGWYLAVFGLLSILFGVFVVVRPLEGALALVWAIGWWAVAAGLVLLIAAFLRRPATDDVAAVAEAGFTRPG